MQIPENLNIVMHPLIQHKLSAMRENDTSTPTFRRLLREISMLLAYEALRNLPTDLREIETPMAKMRAPFITGKKPAFISVLRAGNGLLDGFLDVAPHAKVGFVGLYRDEQTLRPVQYYFKIPGEIESRPVTLLDPMLATGNSAAAAVQLVKDAGAQDLMFVCLLAAPEGVARMLDQHPDVPVLTGALDDHLDGNGFIVPGLGDAGDRIFGTR